jgi:hypothetical protein
MTAEPEIGREAIPRVVVLALVVGDPISFGISSHGTVDAHTDTIGSPSVSK